MPLLFDIRCQEVGKESRATGQEVVFCTKRSTVGRDGHSELAVERWSGWYVLVWPGRSVGGWLVFGRWGKQSTVAVSSEGSSRPK